MLSLQASVVQAFVSLQSLAGPAVQTPLTHVSPTVQNALSLHVTWSGFGVCVHAFPVSSHPSVVHAFVSLQSRALPIQTPPAHVSTPVQNRPSSHGAVLFVCVQTSFCSSQASVVHPFVSAQSRGVPEQTPPLQMPVVVQNCPVPQL